MQLGDMLVVDADYCWSLLDIICSDALDMCEGAIYDVDGIWLLSSSTINT